MILWNGSRFETGCSSRIRTDKQRAAPMCAVSRCQISSSVDATRRHRRHYCQGKDIGTHKPVNNLGRGGESSLSRTVALPARQVSGMRVGDLRAPTRTDAPPEPAVGFCESGNSSSFSFSRHAIFSASLPPTVGGELRCFSFRIGEVVRIITLVNKREG